LSEIASKEFRAQAVTCQHPDCFLENSKYLKVGVGGPVEKDRNGMEGRESSEVEGIFSPSGQVAVELIVDAISQIRVLEESPFFR
jgi:hypothetical protein